MRKERGADTPFCIMYVWWGNIKQFIPEIPSADLSKPTHDIINKWLIIAIMGVYSESV